MASSMQDSIISNTVMSVHSSTNSTENNLQCDTTQELLTSDYLKGVCLKTTQKSNSIKYDEDCCSWLFDFNKAICQLTGCRDYQRFKQLLTIYAKNISKDAFIYNSKLSKLIKLKKHISNILLYYHFHWHDYKEKLGDHYFYLQKMSDILLIYVNLELKFFKKNAALLHKMTNMLINALYIYLGNSEEHIFKVLLKSELLTKQYNKICSIIFEKCFSNIVINQPQLTNITFVRYVLALKIWKSISDDQEEIKKINNFALKIIGSTMPSLCFDSLYFFPQPPKKCINKTIWYLQTKSFNLKLTIQNFLEYEENQHGLIRLNDFNVNKKNKGCSHLQVIENISLQNMNKFANLRNQYLKKKKKLESGKITFIDLTEDDDQRNEEKNIKIKQNLEWLKVIKKKKNDLKCSKYNHKVEIADSTDSYESPVNKIALINLPISDNEVTESYKFDIVDSSCESCDNTTGNNVSILNNSYGIFENSDITKDKKNMNSETSRICSISSDLFDDYICDMLINSSVINNVESNHLSETKLLSSDLNTDSSKELVPSLLDFNLNGIDSLSNDFSYSNIEAIDPCLTRKNFKETCSSSESDRPYDTLFRKDTLLMTFRDNKNQLLTELTDFGLYEVEDKDSSILNDEALITSTDVSSNPFILGLNSDIAIADFSKSSLLDEYSFITDGKEYPISSIDIKHWKKKILKTSGTSKKGKEKIVIEDDEDLVGFKVPEEKKKNKQRHKRKRSATTLKIKEPPTQKIKIPELLILDDETESISWLNDESKLEDNIFSTTDEPTKDSSEKLSSKFLMQKISNFQNLADCIKTNNINKIITLFDSGSSILKNLTSKKIKPSSSHYFIRLLYEKGFLLRHYTEDNGELERLAGVASEKCIALLGKDVLPESLYFQVKLDFSQANILIFFINNLSSVSKWLNENCPRLFIIQEKSEEIESMFITDYLNLIPKPSKNLQFDSNIKLEVIRAETHDKGCQLLAEKLGWSKELEKYEGIL